MLEGGLPLLRIEALGGLKVGPTAFTRPKPSLLLTYLALEGPQRRRSVAALFWPRGNSMKSLSMAMTRLRQGLPKSVSEQDGRIATPATCDALELLGALDDGDLVRVPQLYQGAFLDGVDLNDVSAELEDWVFVTREYLAGSAQLALVELAERADARGDTGSTTSLAEQAFRLPGVTAADPAVLRRLHLLLRVTNSVMAANVWRELASYGLGGADDTPVATQAPGDTHHPISGIDHNFAQESTSFVGRTRELALVAELLADPNCRLLTLTGMGGIGKSRLAKQAALAELKTARYADGVFYVALESASRADDVPLRIAAALGLEPATDALGWQAIAGSLRGRRVLLILDDLDDAPSLTNKLSAILAASPGLDLLVTSRGRLALKEEQVVTLHGLALPDPAGLGGGGEHSDSVRLFWERALKRRRDLDLGAELPHVRDICLSLEGHPLALELAADWVRYLSCAEVATEVATGLGLLESHMTDAEERHGSLRAVINSSWNLLGASEHRALRRLSVFRGPFRREAARRVAGTSLATLARLVDRSLLRALPDGRYDQHPLLGRYVEERASEEPEEAASSRLEHRRWLLELMEEQVGRLRLEGQGRVVRTLNEVWSDFRDAIRWLIAEGETAAVENFIDLMEVSFQVRGAYEEGIEVLRSIEARFGEDPDFDRLTCRALLERSRYHHSLGQFEESSEAAKRAEALVSRRSDSLLAAQVHLSLALVEQARGMYPRSRRRLSLALALAESCEARVTEAAILSALGSAEIVMGNGEAAAACYERVIAMYRESGRLVSVARDLGNLGAVYGRRGDRTRAIALLTEGVALARDHDLLPLLPYGLSNLGAEYARFESWDTALELTTEALQAAEKTGQREIRAAILANLVGILAALGRTADAEARSNESLVMALELDATQKLTQALVARAELEEQLERFDRAATIYALVERDPASTSEVVELATQGLAGLESRFGPDWSSAARRVAARLSLSEAARALLPAGWPQASW